MIFVHLVVNVYPFVWDKDKYHLDNKFSKADPNSSLLIALFYDIGVQEATHIECQSRDSQEYQ